jgi:hypothetical protein
MVRRRRLPSSPIPGSRGRCQGRPSSVEPLFPKKDQAIDYAQNRACFRSGEVRIFDATGNVEWIIPFDDENGKL